jgi:hypothetical protein
MTECKAVEQNQPKISHKSNNSTLSGITVTPRHKKSHGVKCRSVTQKNDTTTQFYCTEHGQIPHIPLISVAL